jgi:hypothetical protein
MIYSKKTGAAVLKGRCLQDVPKPKATAGTKPKAVPVAPDESDDMPVWMQLGRRKAPAHDTENGELESCSCSRAALDAQPAEVEASAKGNKSYSSSRGKAKAARIDETRAGIMRDKCLETNKSTADSNARADLDDDMPVWMQLSRREALLDDSEDMAGNRIRIAEEDDEEVNSQEISVEVRLAFSGVLVTHAKVRRGDAISNLKRIVTASRAWPPGAQQLFLGSRALDPQVTLAAAGIQDDSVVTVACTGLRWHDSLKGSHADISEDGLTVSRRNSVYKFNNAVVIANGLMRSFRFQVIDQSARFSGGVEVGFSKIHPDELKEGLPSSAVHMRRAWICDSHGGLHEYMDNFHALDVDFGEQAWDPGRLREGDIVECRA